jgi:hypothetical protein
MLAGVQQSLWLTMVNVMTSNEAYPPSCTPLVRGLWQPRRPAEIRVTLGRNMAMMKAPDTITAGD